MTLTIREAFELLFAPGALDNSGNATNPDFERRRWFRSAALASMVSPDELRNGDRLLAEKIASRMPAWASGSRLPRPASEIDPLYHVPLRMPYDVFAIAAYLIECAGIYHHLQPEKLEAESLTVPDHGNYRHFAITGQDRKIVSDAADAWSSLPHMDESVTDYALILNEEKKWQKLEPLFESWAVVFQMCAELPVYDRLHEDIGTDIPAWWKHIWRLFAISDEAAKGTGFQFDFSLMRKVAERKSRKIRWFELDLMFEHLKRATEGAQGDESQYSELADITSLSVARQAVVCVLPKVRTPAIGCTLRSLSHHLALLPPAGVVRGRWTPNYIRREPRAGSMPEGVMNLLLVPMPYSLHAQSFTEASVENVTTRRGAEPRFGYFDVNQHWVNEDSARPAAIITFVQALVKATKKQCPSVHGIVFPELSLDYVTFELVREHIIKHIPEVDILISGISSNQEGISGNFVAVTSFQNRISGAGDRQYRQTIREKHHRWKLEKQQLHDYGLMGVLSPELSWWENIALQNRRVDFTVMRQDSVLAAMICEDLARVDPCQQVIRAVGPNLVVALLMDAPQLRGRWPARYATVLAEDPGCSVLTLTSRGLMTRQHRLNIFPSSGGDRVVGLWRDDRNQVPTELLCPYDAQGVLLTLVEEAAEDISLDGRTDDDAKAWRYAGDFPVRIPDAKSKFGHILGEEDCACW